MGEAVTAEARWERVCPFLRSSHLVDGVKLSLRACRQHPRSEAVSRMGGRDDGLDLRRFLRVQGGRVRRESGGGIC